MKSVVVYVCAYYTLYCVRVITSRHTRLAAAEEDAVREQQLKWTQLGCSLIWSREISARQRPLLHKARQSRGLCQTHAAPPEFCTVKSWRCQIAHVGEQRAVAGVGAIREQVASEQATCRAVLFWYGYQMFCVLCLDAHVQKGHTAVWLYCVFLSVYLLPVYLFPCWNSSPSICFYVLNIILSWI